MMLTPIISAASCFVAPADRTTGVGRASCRSPAVDADRRAIRSAACSVQDPSSGSRHPSWAASYCRSSNSANNTERSAHGIGIPDRTSAHAAVEGPGDLAQPCGRAAAHCAPARTDSRCDQRIAQWSRRSGVVKRSVTGVEGCYGGGVASLPIPQWRRYLRPCSLSCAAHASVKTICRL